MTGFEACLDAVRAVAPELSEREVGELFEMVDARRRQLLAAGQARDLAEASEKAALELGAAAREAAVVRERERLINEAKALGIFSVVKAQFDANPALGLEAKAMGTAQYRDSAAAAQRAVHMEYLGGMVYDLDVAGLRKLFTSESMDDDIARALWALDQGAEVKVPAEAKKMAEIVRKWQEKARLDQNAEGAWIGKLTDYITRQSHDSQLLRKAAGMTVRAGDPAHFKSWMDFIRPLLDTERTDLSDDAMREVYVGLATGKHLRTGGGEKDGGFIGPRNLAKKVSASRVLHFKDADSWIAYNERFGVGSVRNSVMRSLDLAAQNVGLMRTFGTNPEHVLNRAVDMISDSIRGDTAKMIAFEDRLPAIRRMMKYLDGSTRIPENGLLAEISAGIRVFENMTKLPMMLLAQFGDLITFASEMKYTFGQSYLSSILDAVKGLGTGMSNPERRKMLSMVGAFADGELADLNTKFGAYDSLSGRMADYQMKFFSMTGARPWTDRLQRRAAEVIAHNLALERHHNFDALPRDLRRTLGQYGITAEHWEKIRSNVAKREDLDYVVVEGIGGDAEEKLRLFLSDRAGYAMLQPGPKTNYYMMWGTDIRRGTYAGEAIKFIGQFKGYPTAFTERVLGREIYGRGANTFGEALTNKNGEMVALAQMFAWTTAMGYLSMTAKELAKGREPRDVTDPAVAWRTMFAASMQGGGLGIYGDFLFGEANRHGRGTASTLLGPAFSDAAGLIDLTKRASRGEAGAGEALRETLRVASGTHPVAAAVVNGYPRIALDYLILHRIQEELSPGYLRRMEERMRNQNSQEYIFPPTQYSIR
jgi:hypothetical protein